MSASVPARDAGLPEGRRGGGRRQRRLPDLAASEAAEASGFVSVGAHLKMRERRIGKGCVNLVSRRGMEDEGEQTVSFFVTVQFQPFLAI